MTFSAKASPQCTLRQEFAKFVRKLSSSVVMAVESTRGTVVYLYLRKGRLVETMRLMATVMMLLLLLQTPVR